MNDRHGIEAEGLVRVFRKGPRAVDGIDLNVSPGEIYGFLGPNGAGKSTTVHMLVTLLPPTEGWARVAGFDVVSEGPKVRAAIGAALQEAALDPLLTGREHLRLQTTMHGLPRIEGKQRGNELLERVGLTRAADRKVRTYSGGMKRWLDLAEIVRALDAESLKVEHLQLHQPSLDDVFLAKTGRKLEGAGEEEEAPAGEMALEPA